jgi:hypothetical protein
MYMTTIVAKKRKNEGDQLRKEWKRVLEKKAMLEMIMSKPEEDRTEEFQS